MKQRTVTCAILIISFLSFFTGKAQVNDSISNTKIIETFFLEGNYDKADSVLLKSIDQFKSDNSYESLAKLVYWSGKLELANDKEKPFRKTLELAKYIDDKTTDPFVLHLSHLDLSRLHNEKGDLSAASKIAGHAKEYAIESKNEEALANSHYYLGEYGLRSGDINSFFENIKKGHQILLDNPSTDFKISARILNYMGAIMYFTSNPDSANYYYENALKKVTAMEDNTENRLYFPAAIKANMVLLKQSQNNFIEAMELAEECIALNKRFLNASEKHPLRFRSQRNLSLAYRNLVSLYEQIGDYDKAHQIAMIAYGHAKSEFQPQLLEYFSAVTLLAETKALKKEFDGSISILSEGKKSLDFMENAGPVLEANYYTILGGAHYGKNDFEKAQNAYEFANKLHLEAQKEAYSSDRLFVIMNLVMCYAKLGKKAEAYAVLDKAYTHQMQTSQSTRLLDALQITKARVSNILNDHSSTLIATDEFLSRNSIGNQNKASKKFEAEAITLNTLAKYHLEETIDERFLIGLDTTLDKAITVLEKRKAVIESKENVNALLSENLEVFDFAKKVNLELYKITNDNIHLTKLIGLHESSIYNRIRTRLSLRDNSVFYGLPKDIVDREDEIRSKMRNTVDDIDSFLKASNSWEKFLDSIQKTHPEYYQMRYATILQPLNKLHENIPDKTTIIRYFFIENQLYAYVINKDNQYLVTLEFNRKKDTIPSLNDLQYVDSTSKALKQLYDQLWAPLKKHINNENVIIYPDAQLFNLSFEMLTPEKINSFNELATKSLLSRYNISYNYSLLLLEKKRKSFNFENDFIAFAPEFTSDMKEDYQLAITDSVKLDKTYLTLLPQPFSSDVAKLFSKKFKGSSFLNQNASKQVFVKTANEHKIIHIGTHAESNNVNPELSRLVFAKNVSDSININDNYLYTYEIYNQNLSSNLAILTACETGKPTYQPGEGMISLAHAFNYAGSESILTSLWQIDEQSSTQILGYFYDYLSEGKPKDEALRLAKLDYLQNANGRTLHPQYWAGLVLMGNTSPIELSTGNHWIWWGLILVALAFLLWWWAQKKKTLRALRAFRFFSIN